MNKNKKQAPKWAYEDNPYSKFGMIYDDMLKAKAYQSLSVASRQLLTVLIVHASTEIAKECLFNAIKERNALLGEDTHPHNISSEVYAQDRKMFVFPKEHYEKYGYTKGYVYKYLKELKEYGFIKVVQCGKNAKKVNIYEFDTKWKRQEQTSKN